MLLSPEKVKEREELIAQGFPDWNRGHYYSFLDGMAVYGRDRLELVAPMVRWGRGAKWGERGRKCHAVASSFSRVDRACLHGTHGFLYLRVPCRERGAGLRRVSAGG